MPTHIRPHRRSFLQAGLAIPAGISLVGLAGPRSFAQQVSEAPQPLYKISLAEYSLHRTIAAGKLDHLDFAPFAMSEFGIDAVEHWNRPWFEKARDEKYLAETKKRADNAGVRSLLIMIDGEGNLGDPDADKRQEAVSNHHKWVEAAKFLGCHSIRVNARSKGNYEEQMKLAADGLSQLAEFAADFGINVLVENHGGLSSNGKWLAGVMKMVGMKNCGTLPDFGNFGDYNRYQGVRELMPWAKAVSAKSHAFNEQGEEVRTDYHRMMKIVVQAGYHDYVGIELEGKEPGEVEGIRLTKKLLESVRDDLSQNNDSSDSGNSSGRKEDRNGGQPGREPADAGTGSASAETKDSASPADSSAVSKPTPKPTVEDLQPSPSDLQIKPPAQTPPSTRQPTSSGPARDWGGVAVDQTAPCGPQYSVPALEACPQRHRFFEGLFRRCR